MGMKQRELQGLDDDLNARGSEKPQTPSNDSSPGS